MLAARKVNLITARARKIKRSACMLANARRDHSIPLVVLCNWALATGLSTLVGSVRRKRTFK